MSCVAKTNSAMLQRVFALYQDPTRSRVRISTYLLCLDSGSQMQVIYSVDNIVHVDKFIESGIEMRS